MLCTHHNVLVLQIPLHIAHEKRDACGAGGNQVLHAAF